MLEEPEKISREGEEELKARPRLPPLEPPEDPEPEPEPAEGVGVGVEGGITEVLDEVVTVGLAWSMTVVVRGCP